VWGEVGRQLRRTSVVVLVAVFCGVAGVLAGIRIAGVGRSGSVRVVEASALAPATGCARGKTLNIVAHEDDDLLFLSPDLIRDIRAGKCVRTIFLTAGDAADNVGGSAYQRERYWLNRERGNRAAYALMAGVKDSWKESHIQVDGHRIAMFTLTADPKISEINMRLPDGNPDGSGSKYHHRQSLWKLRAGEIHTIQAVDGSTSYTKAGLLATMTKLVQSFEPNVIRTQDYITGDFALVGDHSDHTTTAQLAHAASDAYQRPHTFIGYVDYNVASRPANLSGPDLALKQAAFYLYDRYDSQLPCYTRALRANPKNSECSSYAIWLEREYQVSVGPSWNQPCLVPTLPGSYPPSLAAIEAQIRAQGCAVGKVTDSPSESVADGYVISLKPAASTKFLRQGTKVSITESSGPPDEETRSQQAR
jgi:LmbE family N-acetylglucosaminyl deacetylase